ncbi:MAG TPA: hypothetical protein VMS30_00510 [Phycisphaerales bacterium]|nr:hypothetical protein [Phycisphaerales bacterium]
MFSVTNILLGMLLLGMWIVASCTARAACTTMRINRPGLTGAMMLTLLAMGGAIACQFGVGMMMGMSSSIGLSTAPETAQQMRLILAAPIWMLVCAMAYRVLLPTTFGKAMAMFLAQALILGAMIVGFNLLANMTGQANMLEVRQMMPF